MRMIPGVVKAWRALREALYAACLPAKNLFYVVKL
jgi:hypothetical protein